METQITIKADYCPRCGRKIDDWQSWDVADDQLGIPFVCECGFEGTQWHKLVFDGFTTISGEDVFQD